MAETDAREDLRRRDRVAAAEDLPGVPAGTTGRVIVVNGFTWRRYWVRFDNGANVGQLDRAQLTRVDRRGAPVEAA